MKRISLDQIFGIVAIIGSGLFVSIVFIGFDWSGGKDDTVKIILHALLLGVILFTIYKQFSPTTGRVQATRKKFEEFRSIVKSKYPNYSRYREGENFVKLHIPTEGLAWGYIELYTEFSQGSIMVSVTTFNAAQIISPLYHFHDQRLVSLLLERLKDRSTLPS